MKVNNKTIILLIISTLIIPSIAVGANCVILEGNSGLPSLIAKLFTWSLRIGGLVVFGALVYGGFLYLISAGNQSRIDNAKSYMTGAILGMVILLGSFLLLNTINPQLLRNTMEPAPPSQGICLFGENKNGSSTRCCFNSNQTALPDGFKPEELQFQSARAAVEGLYWFDSEDWDGSCTYEDNPKTDPNASSSSKIEVIGLKSFYLVKNQPGVYLYKGTHSGDTYELNCSAADFPNKPYKTVQSSKEYIGDNYNNKVESVQFKSAGKCEKKDGTWVPKITYGAVLHNESEYQGVCSIVGTKDAQWISGGDSTFCANRWVDDLSGSSLYEVGKDSSSITVFSYAPLGHDEGRVVFYEEVGHEGDRLIINANQIDDYWNSFEGGSEALEYPIEDGEIGKVVAGPDSVMRGDTEGELNRILSVKIEGNFMVVLGKDDVGSGLSFGNRCEAITNGVPNLKGHHVLNWPEDDQINAIGIVPTKEALSD